MKAYFRRIKLLLLCLGLILLAYADCRLLFFIFYKSNFPDIGFIEYLKVSWYAIPFDLVPIIYSNILLILMLIIPFDFTGNKIYRKILKVLFLLTNGVTLFANCADLAYFDFIHKRTTFDVFKLMNEQADMGSLLPLFLKDFWYVFVIAIAFVFALNFIFNQFLKWYDKKNFVDENNFKQISLRSLVFVFLSGLTVLGMRGGLQLIPLGMVNAGDNVPPNAIPLLLNTPFSIVKSAELTSLEEKNYFTDAEVDAIYSPFHEKKDTSKFKNMNVVVILLESFSKEYTGIGGKISYTPFLDSLMKQSYSCVNAYSNGKRSIEGIPAALSSLPSMNEAYLNTTCSGNKISSLASVLKKKGYASSFYHGGINGTMSFDSYCKLAGFEKYYGRTEYNNEADADGSWGIWDEPFLLNYATELNQMKQPFVSSVFTLSSHHPFIVPDKYKQQFKGGELPIYKCVQYTDNALRLFFNRIKSEAWYKNTLFVITADHTGAPSDDFAYSSVGSFQIPMMYFKGDNSLKGVDSAITQQIDIMPSVLAQLNYDEKYFAFGTNIFDSTATRYAINYHNDQYQYFYKNKMGSFNGKSLKEIIEINKRSLYSLPNMNSAPEKEELEKRVKAFVQVYYRSLIRNQME